MKINQVKCKNCEQPFDEGFQFCPHCGQKTNDELTIGVLFYNTISNYFSFDARFLKSFLPLLTKPGYLAKEFIKGKRLLYLHPAQMYLFISVIFFFIFSFKARKQAETLNEELKKTLTTEQVVELDSIMTDKRMSDLKIEDSLSKLEIRKALKDNQWITQMSNKEIDSILELKNIPKKTDVSFGFNEWKIDSLINIKATDEEIYKEMGLDDDDGWFMRKLYTQALKFYQARDGGNVLQAFYDTVPIALFFLLPIFAAIIKLLYYNKGRYAHHLVFSFYYFSYLFTVFSAIFGFNLIWDIPDWIDFLIALSTFIYLMIALKRFYGQGWLLSWLKCSVATFTFIAIIIPTAAIIMGLLAFMIY
ncbi:DUF3667 domain-containing protein [Winogradskyella bathintestinalis]|uniref:DUF3667 domain-containing protein n=1 Tax=Winogradskyella bathintestinalis TaxID=3035208 RepID=A0ABT7ZVL6_9FLAO|nr:DUF3667 domain-containing protein [Winogradskyella bathintestinalis]MDN3493062.1 DUF3667 domain-containing protein [Winogradskyella bathintestinalis]